MLFPPPVWAPLALWSLWELQRKCHFVGREVPEGSQGPGGGLASEGEPLNTWLIFRHFEGARLHWSVYRRLRSRVFVSASASFSPPSSLALLYIVCLYSLVCVCQRPSLPVFVVFSLCV